MLVLDSAFLAVVLNINWYKLHLVIQVVVKNLSNSCKLWILDSSKLPWQRRVSIQYAVVLHSANSTFNMYSHCSYSSVSSILNWSLPSVNDGMLRMTTEGKIPATSSLPSDIMLSPGSSFSSKPESFVSSLSATQPV